MITDENYDEMIARIDPHSAKTFNDLMEYKISKMMNQLLSVEEKELAKLQGKISGMKEFQKQIHNIMVNRYK